MNFKTKRIWAVMIVMAMLISMLPTMTLAAKPNDLKTANVNGEAKELDVPATIIDGRFVVPVRFVSESMGANVEWSDFSEIVDINYNARVETNHNPTEQNAIKVVSAYTSGSEVGNDIDKSLDNDRETRWAILGAIYDDTWGVYDFGKEYSLDKIGFSFWRSDQRNAYFRIELSSDGKNWRQYIGDTKDDGINKAGDFKSDGFTAEKDYEYFDLKGEKARYVKIKWGGTNTGTWNSLLEIAFIEKK